MAAFFGLFGVVIASNVGNGGWFALIGLMLTAAGMAGSRCGRMKRISNEEADRTRAPSADQRAPGGIHRGP